MTRARMVVLAVLIVLVASPWSAAGVSAPDEPRPAGRGTRAVASERSSTAADHQSVNINTADVNELMKLSGVGHKVAEKIVEYRDAHGPFKTADDLKKVDGIGRGLFERNRERIVVK